MQVAKNILDQVVQTIQAAQRIVIISHQSPDPDTLGCNLALQKALRTLGKTVQSVCADVPATKLRFLPGLETITQDFQPSDFDLAIAIDVAHPNLTTFWDLKPELASGALPALQIDHHAQGQAFGDQQLIVTSAAATAVITFYLLRQLHAPLTPEIATCLLAGLYYDTGSFMHSNTDQEVLQLAAALTRAGADVPAISRNLFNTHQLNQLRLWGRALERLHCNGQRVATAALTKQDFAETETTPAEDLSGLMDYLNTLPDSQLVLMVHEDQKGNIKGSLRTRQDQVDVSKVAAALGGGGHVKASGFTIPGTIKTRLAWEVSG